MNKILSIALALMAALVVQSAHAAWNADWPKRVKIGLDTTAEGLPLSAPVDAAPLLLRLHTGNFPFLDARPDGADLRFVAADDKTPLKFHIERFDGVNELALVWVLLPTLPAGVKTDHVWLYYGNANAVPAADAKATYDANQVLVLHFGDKESLPQDATAAANHAVASTAKPSPSGLIGGGALFDGNEEIRINAAPTLRAGAAGATLSMWIKPSALTEATLLQMGTSLALNLRGGRLQAQAGNVTVTSAQPLAAGAWQHVALVVREGLTLFVNGQEAGKVGGAVGGAEGAVSIGRGFRGEIDEVQFAGAARSADWVKVAATSQGEAQKLVAYGPAEGGAASGESASYLKILLNSVTLDGWIVIAILAVMFVISIWVMISKAIFISKAAAQNDRFKAQFEKMINAISANGNSADAERAEREVTGGLRDSQLARLYGAGVQELRGRFDSYAKAGRAPVLSEQSLAAIRATVDARLVREMQRLNSKMVLLTISIAGGPFLGLLGTVVGVMITFAAIAAAGDVNVNAIAPGIAAALVATVAGLAVAIPALFGYNYLTGRIQAIASDMQVFVDELVTRFAENHSI